MFVDESMAELAERILEANARRRRPHQCRRRAARLAVLPRRTGRRRGRAADLGRLRDALFVGNHRAAQGCSSAAADDGEGSWAQKVLEYSLGQRYDMTPSSVYLSPAPLYHAAGINYTMAVHRVGAASILMRKFDAEAVLRLIDEPPRHPRAVRADHVRADAQAARGGAREAYDVSSLRCVIHAAAPCPVDVKHQMMEWFGPIIHEYYGGTEGFAGPSSGPRSGWHIPGRSASRSARCTSSDEDGDRTSRRASRASSSSRAGPAFEYFKDPEKTASVSNDRGWRSLGDMGYVDEDGYLYLTDRSTFMIVSGGVNIYPQEVENLLVMHPKLVDAAVFGVPNDEFGEEVKAVVQPVEGVEADPHWRPN